MNINIEEAKKEIRKSIGKLEMERDEMETRGYSFSVSQIEEHIKSLEKILQTK